MISITLKDQSVRQVEAGQPIIAIAKTISPALAKEACAAKLNGELCDLRTVVDADCALEILTFEDAQGKHAFWHTGSHVLAQAVMKSEIRDRHL